MSGNIEVLETLVDDVPEQNPVCQLCHNRKASIHLKHHDLFVCDYCYEDFRVCD